MTDNYSEDEIASIPDTAKLSKQGDAMTEAIWRRRLRGLAARELEDTFKKAAEGGDIRALVELEQIERLAEHRKTEPEDVPRIEYRQPFPLFKEPGSGGGLGTGVGILTPPEDTEDAEQRAAANEAIQKALELSLSFYTGRHEDTEPITVVQAFPHVVEQVARYLETTYAPTLDQFTQHRTWQSGTQAAAEWEDGPAEDIALQAALEWLRTTEGKQNPFSTSGRLQLEELGRTYLEAFATELRVPIDTTPGFKAVKAPPLISTSRPARKLSELGTIKPGETGLLHGGENKLAKVELTFQRTPNNAPLQLTGAHQAVSDGLAALMAAKPPTVIGNATDGWDISRNELTRHLLQTRTRTPSSKQVQPVLEAVEDLAATEVTVTITDYEGNTRTIERPLIDALPAVYKHNNGALIYGWNIARVPVLTLMADALQQTRQVDVMLEGYAATGLPQAVITRFIAATVITWNGTRKQKSTDPYQLTFQEIEKQLGTQKRTRQQTRTIRDEWTPQALDHLKSRGFITEWEPYYKGRQKEGAKVWIPDGWTKADLTSSPHNRPKQIEGDD